MNELEQKGNLCLISFTQNEQHLRFAFAAFFFCSIPVGCRVIRFALLL
jgi:hypothetical protein